LHLSAEISTEVVACMADIGNACKNFGLYVSKEDAT
jgi:hypothetical protein